MRDELNSAIYRWSKLLFGRSCEPISVVTRLGMRALQLRYGHEDLSRRGIPTDDAEGNSLDIVQRTALLAGEGAL